MRLVQVTIPAGKREAVRRVLENEGIDYVLTDETSQREYTAVVYFPLPRNAVEPILERLRDAGLSDESYTVVMEAQTVISRHFDQLTERYKEEEKSDERIAREELRSTAQELAPARFTYAVMTIVSGVIATAGLLLNSPAVVVGSMVIAPLIGPAMATAVGTVIDDSELFVRGAKYQVLGFAFAIGSAAVFAYMVRVLHLVPPNTDVVHIEQVRERLSPDFLSLVVALGAGVAGAFSLSSGVSASLVGVMIAVALVPPAATVGIGIAWGLPSVVVGSGILALVNALSINLAALTVLWYMGYRPQQWFQLGEAKSATIKRVGFLVIAIAVLSVFLGGVTYDSYQNANFEENVRMEVTGVLEETGGEYRLLEVDVEYNQELVFRDPRTVTVTVGVPPGADTGTVVDRLDARIDTLAGHDVAVRVHYILTERRE